MSVFGHTRHFYPVGNGIKINHYFPGKDYRYNYPENVNDQVVQRQSKPVQETEQEIEVNSSISAKDELKTVPMVMENKEQTEQENGKDVKELQTPAVNAEVAKSVPLNVEPAVVTIMADSGNEDGTKETIVTMPNDKQTEQLPKVEKTQTKDDEKLSAEDSYHDSETASSYSHSRFYYAFQ